MRTFTQVRRCVCVCVCVQMKMIALKLSLISDTSLGCGHTGCFRGAYFQLTGQFKAAGLTPYTNFWHQIHDFTKGSDGLNYALSTASPEWLEDFFSRKPAEVAAVQVTLQPLCGVVAITLSSKIIGLVGVVM